VAQKISSMKIKPAIVELIKKDYSEFCLIPSSSLFYAFRCPADRSLFNYIKFQRDGQAGALAVDIATTYDPNWNLYPANPIGLDYPLVTFKNQGGNISAEGLIHRALEPWYVYGNDENKFLEVLNLISDDIAKWGTLFFKKAAKIIEADELLQYGLRFVREKGLLSTKELTSLEKERKATKFLLSELKNERFCELKEHLTRRAETLKTPAKQRQRIPSLALSLLLLEQNHDVKCAT